MGGSKPKPSEDGAAAQLEGWRGSLWAVWGLLWLELPWKPDSPGLGRGSTRRSLAAAAMAAAFGLR